MSFHSQLTGTELHEAYHFVQETDPGAVGSNLYWLKVSTGIVKRRNAGNSAWDLVSPGANKFTDLTDVPASYTGQADRVVAVKTDETGLKFITPPTTFLGLTDTPSSYTGQSGKAVAVKSTEDGLEFVVSGGGSGAGWVLNSPDNPPVSPGALDDEFTTNATLPGGGSPLWTWNNQGGASATILNKRLTITAPAASGNNMRTLEQSTPATPWVFTTKISLNARPGQNYATMGFFLRDTVSGRCYAWGPVHDTNDNLTLFKFSNTTSVASVPVADLAPWTKSCYLQVADDGTNVDFRHSVDGFNFVSSFTEPRLTYLTSGVNRVGLCVCSNNASIPCIGSFLFFRQT
jgi:hypothetical protein